MGLGPPICDNCEVMPEFKEHEWKCPICGSTIFYRHTGLFVDLKKYKDNLKFLKFVKGETDGNI